MLNKLTFEFSGLTVDWISFNIQGLIDRDKLHKLALGLTKYFNPTVFCDDILTMGFSGYKKKYKVSVRQYTGSKDYWVGTRIIFSGKSAAYFYKLVKTQKFDWNLLKFVGYTLSLARVDLCFCRINDLNHTIKLFDSFLVDSRSQIQNQTNTRYIKLEDFPDGKMLKINRRNNSLHYRVYQKNERVRFELEFKHRQTKSVQDYLFQNHLDIFEDKLVLQFFKYSGQVLCLYYEYADWILDFRRKYGYGIINTSKKTLLTSYLENRRISEEEEEERLFHLLQFLSFIQSLELNLFKYCKKLRVKKQNYYRLKFSLSKFVKFTGIKISNKSDRRKLIGYFKHLHKLDPIVKEFSDGSFRSYVCFLYADCENLSGKAWVIEVFVAEELFWFPYPFHLPKSFLMWKQKNDLRLKVRLLKSLAVKEQEKIFEMEDFFNTISVRNNQLIQIKENLIQLLKELVINGIIHNQLVIILKSGKRKDVLIKNLNVSDITRRIKYLKFIENIKTRV